MDHILDNVPSAVGLQRLLTHQGQQGFLLALVYKCRTSLPAVLTSLEKELVGGLKSEFYALPSCSPESSGKGILAFLVYALILRIIPTQKYISSFDSPEI